MAACLRHWRRRLRPALRRANLAVLTKAQVTRVLIEEGRATLGRIREMIRMDEEGGES